MTMTPGPTLPDSWRILPLKHVVTINPDVLREDTDPLQRLRYIDIGDVDSRGRLAEGVDLLFGDAPTRARRLVEAGDTIVSTVRTYLRAIAYLPSPPPDIVVSTGFAVLRPGPSLYPPFLARACQSEPFVQMVMANSEGVSYPSIAPTDLGRLPIWVPPLDVQRRIADHIDREAAMLDELVERLLGQVVLLGERRSATITAGVTGQFDVARGSSVVS
jgi:type I restriction enzyme S subunit